MRNIQADKLSEFFAFIFKISPLKEKAHRCKRIKIISIYADDMISHVGSPKNPTKTC
jgi:hypothetical protein